MRLEIMRLTAAALAGVIAALSFAPLEQWLLMPPPLMVLFYLILSGKNWRAAAAAGFVFGGAFFACGLWWIFGALSGYIGLPVVAAAGIMILLCAALALYPALAAAAARWIGGNSGNNNIGGGLALAGLWALAEWLRGQLFSGFPWLAIGYSQTPDSPFFGWLPLVGIVGVNFLLALFCVLPICVLPMMRRRHIIAAATVMIIILGGGFLAAKVEWTKPAGEITMSLLQGNVEQKLKWQKGAVQKALGDYLRLADESPGKIIILPETALPMRRQDLPQSYLLSLQSIAAARQGAIVAGMFVEEAGALYNAAVVIGDTATTTIGDTATIAIGDTATAIIGDYRKRHLTPYGEYLPFAAVLRPLLLAADIPYNSLAAGKRQSPLNLPGVRVAVAICYEDIFSDEWRAQLPAAQVLVNITNDGWFDGSAMQAQHRQISQARAAEFGRSLARAANTGATAIINHKGRIVGELPPNTQGALHGEVTLREGATPFVRYGELPILIIAALMILAAIIRRRRM